MCDRDDEQLVRLGVSGFVETRFHLRGRASSLAKTSSDAIEVAVPAFSC